MCQFKSAIVLRNGDILANQYTDSHEDLVRLFKLRDSKDGAFARVEFRPDSPETLDDEKTYKLKIDEQREPEWFDVGMKERVAEKMRGWIKAMIIFGDVDMLCGGAYIVAAGANVACVKNALIHVMMKGSNVGVMWGSSNVGEMWGSSNVGVMRESSNVGEMRESSNVGVMRESSNVGEMRESSNVGEMWESSNVGEMWESSNVGVMWESSNVGVMWGSSKVKKDERISKLETK